jgi:hypothetical protein
MTSLHVAAFVAITLIQGPAAPSGSPTGAPQGAQPPPAPVSAKQYLDNAKQTLTGVAEESLPKDARKVFSQLQSDFAGLSSAYSTGQPPLHVDADAKTTDIEGVAPDWMSRFYDVERDLALLIGGGAMLAPAANSLLGPDDVPDISLLGQKDPNMANRVVLERFRVQLELFYDATGRGGLVAARSDG